MSFAVFDPVVLADLVMLDDDSPDDMLAQVMNLFVRDTKAGLLEVETTVRAGDLVALRRRLHSIKGAGAQVGARAERSRTQFRGRVEGGRPARCRLAGAPECGICRVRRSLSKARGGATAGLML